MSNNDNGMSTTTATRGRALLSGASGALASCLGKFAMSPQSPLDFHLQFTCPSSLSLPWVCFIVKWVPRGLCFVSMILVNAYMVGAFLKGLEESGSVAGTGLATAANFVVSALFGYFLWGEDIHVGGSCLVLMGAILLSMVNVKKNKKQKEQERQGKNSIVDVARKKVE